VICILLGYCHHRLSWAVALVRIVFSVLEEIGIFSSWETSRDSPMIGLSLSAREKANVVFIPMSFKQMQLIAFIA